MGGIGCAEDALEFLIAGASAVAVGTASLVDPSVYLEVLEGIAAFCANEGLASVRDLVGSLRLWDAE